MSFSEKRPTGLLLLFTECNRVTDIAFILDSSGSLPETSFNEVKNFASNLIDLLNVDAENSNVAAISFSSDARIEFQLDDFNTRDSIQTAIQNIPYVSGTTNTAQALQRLREEIFKY